MSNLAIPPALAKDFLEEEDFSVVFGFDDEAAWNRLHSFANITELSISSAAQEELKIVVGRQVSDEHRWKAINKDKLQHILLAANDGKDAKLIEMLQELEPGASILIEYVPERSGDEDVFLVYADVRELNEASEIVRKLELLQRLKLKMLTVKIFRKQWVSESDIERWKSVPETVKFETKALALYPFHKRGDIGLRTTSDVRDGFVELLPIKWKTTNMPRKITDQGTQVRRPAANRSIQTEPTFPSNAATQYLFDAAESYVDPALIPKEWLEWSTESLSKEVQFNLIDQYKNEYTLEADAEVARFNKPRIDEVLSFMNREMCVGRSVCSMDWHPELSGIFVAAYTFETLSKQSASMPTPSGKGSDDTVNRMLFEKCPILMWTFADPLEPLLELNSIREVTAVSFCPYDGELLVGGLTNGQIALWDLAGEIDRVELAKEAARESNDYRREIRQLMEDSPTASIDRSVSPAALSSLEHSSRSAITSIKWLPRNHFCTTTGHLKTHPEKLHRFVVTSSLDGSVCFWDLDFSMPALQKMIASKKGASQVVEKTIYQRVNNLFYPTFKLLSRAPIGSMLVDDALYFSSPEEHSEDITHRVSHLLRSEKVDCKTILRLGTYTGQLLVGTWEGYDFEQGALVNDELLQVTHILNPIHDGPIVALERNNHLRDVFLSIGGHVLALWSEEDYSSAVFWRKTPFGITAGRWSLDRAAVFFIGLANGDFEIWDLNMKTFRACVSMNLGSQALTFISQHRLACGRHRLAIADGNANVRILSFAKTFVGPVENEANILREIIQHELSRKASQAAWTKEYDVRCPKNIETEAQVETVTKENGPKKPTDREKRAEVDAAKAKKLRESEKRMPLSDRLEHQYREKRFARFLEKLMERRNVSSEQMAREMRPEVERRRYNVEKRSAIAATVSQADGDFASVQRVLRPVEESSLQPVVKRDTQVHKYTQDIANYRQVEAEAKEMLNAHYLPDMESFEEVLMKSHERRERVCIRVGTNMEHVVSYENKRSLRRRGLAPRTLLDDIQPIPEVEEDIPEKDDEREQDIAI